MTPETFYEQARLCMLNSQIRPNGVESPALLEAFKNTPREIFLPESLKERAYLDSPLKIAENRYIFEPMVFAKLAGLADIKAGERVLLIGVGSGYEAAVLSALGAGVTAIEEDETLLTHSLEILKKAAPSVRVLKHSLKEGVPTSPPWDVIFINGGTEIWPEKLLNSLKPQSGRLVCVVMKDDHWGVAVRINPRPVLDKESRQPSALEEIITRSLVADWVNSAVLTEWVKGYKTYCEKLLKRQPLKKGEAGALAEISSAEGGFEVKTAFQATVPVLPAFKKLREFAF